MPKSLSMGYEKAQRRQEEKGLVPKSLSIGYEKAHREIGRLVRGGAKDLSTVHKRPVSRQVPYNTNTCDCDKKKESEKLINYTTKKQVKKSYQK